MKHRRYFEFLSGLPLILVLLGVLCIAAPSYGKTLKVGTCDHATYPTIQAAVTAASPGDMVKVCPGLYSENVTISKSLTLLGAGPAAKDRTGDASKESVIAPLAGIGVDVTADDVVIDGFTLVGTTAGSAGLQTSPLHSGYLIRDNYFDVNPNNGQGIHFACSGAEQTVVEHNFFNGNRDKPGANNTDGMFSNEDVHNAVIRENTFTRSMDGAGIVLGIEPADPGVTISDVTIEHNKSFQDDSFVAMFNAPGTVLDHNEVEQSFGSSFFIGGGNDGSVITHNKVSDGAYDAIQTTLLFGGTASTDLEISHNDIDHMGRNGIYASGFGGPSMTSSLVSDNHSKNNVNDGIKIGPLNSGNTILNNDMKGNTNFDAEDDSSGTGTAGTANTWLKNKCNTSFPLGLCK